MIAALAFHVSTRAIADTDFWLILFLCVVVSIDSAILHGKKR